MRDPADAPVFLAPMAGITALPFRERALRFGASSVVSEMVASGDLLRNRPEAWAKAALGLGRARSVVQIAGREPGPMAEAARFCAAEGAAVIDLNFGCPSKMVTNGLSGSALMRDADHALRLVEGVAAAVSVPVTVKMRLGWDRGSLNAADIARRAEAAGVARVTVHGRTRSDFYRGRADWAAIGAVVRAVEIPVLANGDIACPGSARQAMDASRAAGVMVGRGAYGRPWLPGQIAAFLADRPVPAAPEGAARGALVAEHYEAMLHHYGCDLGVRVARKHLSWYLDGVAAPAHLRRAILTSGEPGNVLREIATIFAGSEPCESFRVAA